MPLNTRGFTTFPVIGFIASFVAVIARLSCLIHLTPNPFPKEEGAAEGALRRLLMATAPPQDHGVSWKATSLSMRPPFPRRVTEGGQGVRSTPAPSPPRVRGSWRR